MKKAFALACFAIFIFIPFAYADQGGFTNSGGKLTIVAESLTFLSTDSGTGRNPGAHVKRH